jgi:Uncharacterised nucleotidyltransferase
MNVQAAVMTLGGVQPDEARLDDALAYLEKNLSPGGLYDLLRVSKVSRLARVALAGRRSSPWATQLYELLDAEVTEDDEWQASALPIMRTAVEAVTRLDGVIMKGLSVQSLYPDPGLRHVGDIDAHYPSWSAAQPLARWLRSNGWVYDTDEYPWLKWHDIGVIYGQQSFVYPDNKAPVARVDLHVGPYSVGFGALLPMSGHRDGGALGLAARVPTAETAISIVAAHAVCDQLLSVKDINDLHVLVTDSVPDWVSVTESCRAVQSELVLAQLLHVLRDSYPLDADRLPPSAGRESDLRMTPPSGTPRARSFARLAFADERLRGVGVMNALRRSRMARRYFSATLTPRTGTDSDGGPVPGNRGRGSCWRLVPEEIWRDLPASGEGGSVRQEELDAGLTLTARGSSVVLRWGTDVFIPTVWGVINPASVKLARDVAEDGQ